MSWVPKEHENMDSFGEGKKQRLRSKILVVSVYFIIMPVFLASLGAPRTRGASSSSFCLCILHTRCQTFSRCSEPIKGDDVYWKQYKPGAERGWVCGVRLCWEPKVHEACIITYIDKIKILSTCLFIVVSHTNGRYQNLKDLLEIIWLKMQTL